MVWPSGRTSEDIFSAAFLAEETLSPTPSGTFRMSVVVKTFSSRTLSFFVALAVGCGIFAVSLLLAPQTKAANGINRQMNYQAKLLDSTGDLVADGSYSIKFSLYDAASGGNRLWTATGTLATPGAMTVAVQNGLFTILLGDTSLSGGSQLSLEGVDWNSDSLYLGVTVSSDSEMSPRKRLAAAPQAFNSQMLQGMYASSTIGGGNSLFVVNQAGENAATGTRTALEVRSSGLSDLNDYLVRAINSSSTPVFTVNRQGNTTSSGYLAVMGSGTSTFTGGVTVGGQAVCLADGTNCLPASGSATDLNWAYDNTSNFVRNNTSTTDIILGSTATSTGAPIYFDFDGTLGRSNTYFGHNTTSNVIIGGTSTTVSFMNTLFNLNGNDLFVGGNIGSASTVYSNGGFVVGTSTTIGNGFIAATGSALQLTLSSTSGTKLINNVDNLLTSAWNFNMVSTTSVGAGPRGVFVRGRYAYVVNNTAGTLSILDVTNPSAPSSTATFAVAATPTDVYVNGRYAYISHFGATSLSIVDVSNPGNPALVGTLTGAGSHDSLVIQGSYAYLSSQSSPEGLVTVNISNPSRPVVLSNNVFVNIAQDVAVQGKYAFLVDFDAQSLHAIDVSNPQQPFETSSVTVTDGFASNVVVQGRYAYVLNTFSTASAIAIVDISDATNLRRVKDISLGGSVTSTQNGIYVNGRYLYVMGSDNHLYIYDVSNVLSPQQVASITINATGETRGLFVSGRYAYIALNADAKLAIVDIGGMETNGLIAQSAELGNLQVLTNGLIGQQLNVGGGINVGRGGIHSDGSLSVAATNTTSSINGSLTVGTSTFSVALNSLFTMNGDDLYVQGNIGSVSSVYTNGSFVAGMGSMYYGDGQISKTNGNITLSATGGYILPSSDLGLSLGNSAARFNGYFGNTTSTNVTSTNLFVSGTASTTGLFATGVTTTNLSVGGSVSSTNLTVSLSATTTNLKVVNSIDNRVSVSSDIVSLGVINLGIDAPVDIAVAGKYAYTIHQGGTYGALTVTDIQDAGNAANGSVVTTTHIGSGATNPQSIVVAGRYAFVTASNGLNIFDISTTSTANVGTLSAFNDLRDVVVQGGYAYVTEVTGNRLTIVDLANATSVSSVTISQPRGLAIQGPYAFVASFGSDTLKIVDISNPRSPAIVGSASTGVQPTSVAVQGRYAYVSGQGTQLIDIIDIAGVSSPVLVTSTYIGAFGTNFKELKISGRYLYSANPNDARLHVLDISNPASPVLLRTLATDTRGFTVAGRYAYMVSNTNNRIAVIDLTGIETNGLIAHSAELGSLEILTNGRVANNFIIGGGLHVGAAGILSEGGVFSSSTSTTSTFSGSFQVLGHVTSTGGIFSNFLTVGGQNVCLANGTNCPASSASAADLNWVYDNTNNFVRNNTSTTDLILGNTATSTGAPLYFDLAGQTSGTSTLYIAHNTNTNVVIGGTSSSVDFMNAMFSLNGNDLFVAGNIGSASSVYTNGSFVVGTGSMYYGNGSISKTDGNITLSASAGYILPATDLGLSFGNSATRFNGYFGNTTSTNATTTNLNVSGTASTTRLFANQVTSTNLFASTLNFASASGTHVTSTSFFSSTFTASEINSLNSSSTYTSSTNLRVFNSITNHMTTGTNLGGLLSSLILDTTNVNDTAYAIAVQGRYAYVIGSVTGASGTMFVVDLTNPRAPSSTGAVPIGTLTGGDIAVQGNYAYIVDTNGTHKFHVVDISEPSHPRVVGRIVQTGTFFTPQGVTVQGRYAYVTNDQTGPSNDDWVSVIDVADPAKPVMISSVNNGFGATKNIAVQGRYVYATVVEGGNGAEDRFLIVDMTNPSKPAVKSNLALTVAGSDLAVQGNYAYISSDSGNMALEIVDISNATGARMVSTIDTGSGTGVSRGLYVSGRYAYLGGGTTYKVIDISNPLNPAVVASGSGIAQTGTSITDVAFTGRYLITAGRGAVSYNMLSVIDTMGVDTASLLADSAEIGTLNVRGNTSIYNQLSVGGGVMIGDGGLASRGALSVYATNTTSTFLGNLAVGTSTFSVPLHSLFTMNGDDLYVQGNIGSVSSIYSNGGFVAGTGTTFFTSAAISNTSATLTISSVSSTRLVGNVDNGFGTDTNLNFVTSTAVGSAPYGTFVSGKYLYVANKGSGPVGSLSILDVQNPAAPAVVTTTLISAAGGPQSVFVNGRYAYVSVYLTSGSGFVAILDVSNPASSTIIGSITGLNGPWTAYAAGRYLYVTMEQQSSGSFRIYDVADPRNPVLLTNYTGFASTQQPSGVYVQGRYAYVTDRFNAQLRIFDVSNPQAILLKSTFSTSGQPRDVIVQGKFAYIATAGGVDIVNIADAANPLSAGTAASGIALNQNQSIALQGRYLYTVSGTTLRIYDVLRVATPVLLKTQTVITPTTSLGLTISGRYLYVTDSGGSTVSIYDTSGLETTGLIANSAEIGTLQVLNNAQFANDLSVRSSLSVGSGGIFSDGALAIYTTNTTSTFFGMVSTSRMTVDSTFTVAGQNVCLANGTNCPTGTADLNWTYNLTSDFVRNATPTTDFVLGNTVTSTGAPLYFDLAGQTSGTSTLYIGHNTNTNVVIGGTSSSVGFMNALFSLNGNDLFVAGNIGSASSVYTNGGFVAGTGSMYYDNGSISKTDGNITLSASAGYILPASDLGLSFGNSATRFNGYFGNTTSTNATTTNLAVTGMASTTNLMVADTATTTVFYASTTFIGPGAAAISAPAYLPATPLRVLGPSGAAAAIFTDNGNASLEIVLGDTPLNNSAYIRALTSMNLVFGAGNTARWAIDSASGVFYPLTNNALDLGAATFSIRNIFASGTIAAVNQVISGNSTTTHATTTNLFVSGTASTTALFANGVTTTNLNVAGTASTTNLNVANNVTTTNLTVVNSLSHALTSNTTFNVVTTTTLGGSANDIFISGRYAYVVTSTPGELAIFDVSTAATPTIIGRVSVGAASKVTVSERYAYVVDGTNNTLHVIDVSAAATPRIVGAVTGLNSPSAVSISGRYAYVTNLNGVMFTIDIADPTNPRVVGQVSGLGNFIQDIAVNGRYAFFAAQANDTLYAVDVSNPNKPVVVGTSGGGTDVTSIRVRDRYLYMGGSNALLIFDVSDPTSMFSVNAVVTGLGVSTMDLAGRYAYVGNQGGTPVLAVVDVQDPTTAYVVKNITSGIDAPSSVVVSGRYGYVLNGGNNTFTIIDVAGIETNGLIAHSAELGTLQVLQDARIASALTVGNSLNVGRGGIFSDGSIGVGATNTTSSIMGNLAVGTSTLSVAMNALFTMNGDDLFVGGNIGSVSSVYTNGSFVAGTGSMYYGDGQISKTNGNITLSASAGYVLPATDLGLSFGNSATRFNGYFGNTTSTNATTTNLTVTGTASTTNLMVSSNLITTSLNAINGVNGLATSTGAFAQVGSTGVGGTGGFTNMTRSGDNLIVSSYDGNRISIVDVSNPAYPVNVTSMTVGASPWRMFSAGKYVYLSLWDLGKFVILDLTAPSSTLLSPVSELNGFSQLDGIYVQGRYAYLSYAAGFAVVDISNPRSPLTVKTLALDTGRNYGVFVAGDYAYVTNEDNKKMYVIKVSDPASAFITATYTSAELGPRDIVVKGRYAYIAFTSGSVEILDVGNPFNPVKLSSIGSVGAPNNLDLHGRYLYVAGNSNSAVSVIDVASSTNPVLVKAITTGSTSWDVLVSGRYLYVGTGAPKAEIYDVGGAEFTGLVAHSGRIGNLDVLGDSNVYNQLNVGGGIVVGNGGINSQGGLSVVASSTSSTVKFLNTQPSTTTGLSWGAYIDQLVLGPYEHATGTADYEQVIAYEKNRAGLCLFELTDAGVPDKTCPISQTTASIVADEAINGSAFDVAERYSLTGSATSSDVLVWDTGAAITAKVSSGIPYDPNIAGIASTKPAFLLGWDGPIMVALDGRVPTKVSAVNGAIRVGDPLTTSQFPGVAMKASKPGMIIGYALENADATSTIEVFVKVGYSAQNVLSSDGTVTRFTDNIVLSATSTASSTNPTVDSWGFTFRGSAWDGTQATNVDFTFLNDVTSATTSQISILNSSSTPVFSLDQAGTARVAGDVIISGKLYPSARGTAQTSKYIFLDDSLGPTSTYIATNADGWQANDSYDFAERYYSPDKLEPGDLVIVSQTGRLHVQRSREEKQMLMGIVSTKPAFVAGKPATSTYPIALAGRVPTKVSNRKGAIKSGDSLASSNIPGVAVKATEAGPTVGIALEDFDGSDVGLIEVFVNVTWWGGDETAVSAPSQPSSAPAPAPTAATEGNLRGLARILSGAMKVHVTYDSIHAYPHVLVTPQAQVEGGWWTENLSDTGFDIRISAVHARDLTFTWEVVGAKTGEKLFLSDGTYATFDPGTGTLVTGTGTTTTEPVSPSSTTSSSPTPEPTPAPEPAPVPEPAPEPTTTTTTEPVVPPEPVPVPVSSSTTESSVTPVDSVPPTEVTTTTSSTPL